MNGYTRSNAHTQILRTVKDFSRILKLNSEKQRLKPFVFCPHGHSDRLRQNREPSSPLTACPRILELNSPSQKWRAFPEISARLCQPFTVFRSNVPFLNAMARILSSWTRAHRADVHFNKHPHDLFQVPCGVCFQWFVPERSPSYPDFNISVILCEGVVIFGCYNRED